MLEWLDLMCVACGGSLYLNERERGVLLWFALPGSCMRSLVPLSLPRACIRCCCCCCAHLCIVCRGGGGVVKWHGPVGMWWLHSKVCSVSMQLFRACWHPAASGVAVCAVQIATAVRVCAKHTCRMIHWAFRVESTAACVSPLQQVR